MAESVVRIAWNGKQWRAIHAPGPFIDLEGGLRAGKTLALLGRVFVYVTTYPGIHGLLFRWTEEDTFAQLVPEWRKFADRCGLTLKWHPDEQYDEVVGYGSRLYLRGLRSSDSTRPYAAIRGLDLAFFGGEQAEELPESYWGELVGRLSQVGFPHWGMITPQPVAHDHWIAKAFPEHNPDPNALYLRTNVYDNRKHVGDAYVRQLEAQYPPGSSQRRTLLEGQRGLAVVGDPVYAGYFRRQIHVSESAVYSPLAPLGESWDFGHGHPCVSWWQFLSIGRLQCLGAVMGEDMYLEDFAPAAAQYRSQWFGTVREIQGVGDPMGLDITNQGVAVSKIRDVLATIGSYPISQAHANRLEVRAQAIQQISGYMQRFALDGGPAFLVHPRAVVLGREGPKTLAFHVDGFEAGYIYDTRAQVGVSATVRRPKKDGYFDHFQNTAEYYAGAYAPQQATRETLRKVERRELRRAQQDDDEYRVGRRVARGRGGY